MDRPVDHESAIEALRRAVALIGSQSATARLLGVTQATVSKWLSKGQLLPADHVIAVEKATSISRHDLNPVIYPRDAAPAGDAPRFEHAR